MRAYAFPIFLPLGAGPTEAEGKPVEGGFEGVIDVVNQKAINWGPTEANEGLNYEIKDIPPKIKERAEAALAELIDAVSNKDDEIANLVLEEKPITAPVLKAAIRRLTCKIELVPVLCGSAFKKKAVQVLVDAVVDYLPSPLDIPGAEGHEPGTEVVVKVPKRTTTASSARSRSNSGPILTRASWCSSAFIPASLRKGDNIYNPRTRKRERVSRLMVIQGSERKDINEVFAGDIAALVGLRNITTGDTLCDEDFDVTLEPPTFPEPVISMAVEPKTKQDRDKMSEGLQRLAEEDPTFRCFTNEETSQLIIAGMGELHLEIIIDRLKREFKVEANTGAPQIAYRETITKKAEGEGKFIRQSGGKGQYGHACITVAPNEKGKGVEVVDEIVGGSIPKEYIPAVIDGIEEAIKGGVYAGYQVIDIKVEVVDGSFHEVDSNELAFRMAGIFALKDAFKKAGPDFARTDHESGMHHAGRISGRSARRHQPSSRHDCQHRGEERPDHSQRAGAAGGNVRLRHGDPFALERPRLLFDGAVDLCAGAEQRPDDDPRCGGEETGGAQNEGNLLNFYSSCGRLGILGIFGTPAQRVFASVGGGGGELQAVAKLHLLKVVLGMKMR